MNFDYNTNHKLLFATSFIGFLVLSLLIAIGPASVMQNNIEPLLESQQMTASQTRGFKVYISENCAVCHTQQVRPLKMDNVYGRASVPNDFAHYKPIDGLVMTPNVLGTARIGPDLSDVGSRRNNDMWNYTHLYNPRAVVKESVMPSYHWLFEEVDSLKKGDVVVPVPAQYKSKGKYVIATKKAQDLIAYLDYLKQPPVTPSDLIRNNGVITNTSEMRFSSGKQIFETYCASCHGSNGEGEKNAYPPLKSSKIILDNNPSEFVKLVLEGHKNTEKYGKMPGYKGLLTDPELESLINYVKKSWGNGARLVSKEEIDSLRIKFDK